jgi:hypothetical protein
MIALFSMRFIAPRSRKSDVVEASAPLTPQLTSLLDIPRSDLPMIWDADFMRGPPGPDGADSYVLGEINVSSVFPIPDEAPAEIARRVADRLRSKL